MALLLRCPRRSPRPTISPRWTVGLLATLMSVACIIAADVGAYFVGKNFGRTK